MSVKGTTRKIGASGGGYMTAGGHWVGSFWKTPKPFTGSAGAQVRRNRRRDIRKNGYGNLQHNWTDAAYSPLEWIDRQRGYVLGYFRGGHSK